MEHVKIQDVRNGSKRLVPEPGYVLVKDGHHYSEVVTKDPNHFKVISLN